jgi:hypothetical protein
VNVLLPDVVPHVEADEAYLPEVAAVVTTLLARMIAETVTTTAEIAPIVLAAQMIGKHHP